MKKSIFAFVLFSAFGLSAHADDFKLNCDVSTPHIFNDAQKQKSFKLSKFFFEVKDKKENETDETLKKNVTVKALYQEQTNKPTPGHGVPDQFSKTFPSLNQQLAAFPSIEAKAGLEYYLTLFATLDTGISQAKAQSGSEVTRY